MSLERWDEESTEREYQVMEVWHSFVATSWGNSYIATSRTALAFSVPEHVVWDILRHYDEVVYDGEV